jgi:outer membrane murein-binding lipoprotein Lpp
MKILNWLLIVMVILLSAAVLGSAPIVCSQQRKINALESQVGELQLTVRTQNKAITHSISAMKTCAARLEADRAAMRQASEALQAAQQRGSAGADFLATIARLLVH